MNTLLVLDKGRIIEKGVRSDLIDRNGLYARRCVFNPAFRKALVHVF